MPENDTTPETPEVQTAPPPPLDGPPDLAPGDRVYIPAVVLGVQATPYDANVTVETELGRKPDKQKTVLQLNGAHLIKVALFLLAMCLTPAWPAYAQATKPRAAKSTAQPQKPQVDVDEVLRRGDMVVAAGQGPRADTIAAISDALAPPIDDSHKWFITVIVDGSDESKRLEADLHKTPLSAFVQPADPKASWSHYARFQSNDRTNDWRWKDIKIVGYPTVIIQPPRNRGYGDPTTVVTQLTGYKDPAKLADEMRKAIIAYVRIVQTKKAAAATHTRDRTAPVANGFKAGPEQGEIEDREPPFPLPGPLPTPTPAQIPSFPFPTEPPAPSPNPNQAPGAALALLLQLIGGLLGGGGMTNVLLMAVFGIQLFRSWRQAKGLPTILNEAQFSALVNALKAAAGQTKPTTPNA